jgi:hypothetical protein
MCFILLQLGHDGRGCPRDPQAYIKYITQLSNCLVGVSVAQELYGAAQRPASAAARRGPQPKPHRHWAYDNVENRSDRAVG